MLQYMVQQHRHATCGYHMGSRHLVLEQVSQQGKEAAGSRACSSRAYFERQACMEGWPWSRAASWPRRLKVEPTAQRRA